MIEMIVSNPKRIEMIVSEIQTPLVRDRTHVSWFETLVSWAGGVIADWNKS